MYGALKLAPNSKTSLLSTTSTTIPPSSFACSCQFHSYFALVRSYKMNCFCLTSLIILHLHLYVNGLFSDLSSLKFS